MINCDATRKLVQVAQCGAFNGPGVVGPEERYSNPLPHQIWIKNWDFSVALIEEEKSSLIKGGGAVDLNIVISEEASSL